MSGRNTQSDTHTALANQHGPSLTTKKVNDQITTILRLILCFNFLIAPVKDGLAPLVSVYLVAEKGWDAGRAGIIWFTRDISALLCQTCVGGFVDGFENKRLLLILATASASIAASSMVFTQNFAFLIMKSIVEGVATCFITPCKNSVVLGLIGHEQFDEVAKANEIAHHAGSFLFIVIAGVVSFVLYPNNVGVFYIIGAGGLMACLSLLLMPLTISEGESDSDSSSSPSSIPDGADARGGRRSSNRPGLSRTRSLIDQKSSRNLEGEEATSYSSIIKDKNIAIFASSVFFFHLGNAAVLPLLSQTLAIESGRAGIPFTCANVAIAQISSMFATWGMGLALKRGIPYKIPLIVGYAFAVPIRCFAIVLLLKFWPNNYALLAMQLFDGVGVGTYGLSLTCLTNALTKGTGRFSFTLGFIITMHMVGAALSNLIGGYIVNLSSYIWGFISLGAVGSASVFLASFIHVKDHGHGGSVTEDLTMKRHTRTAEVKKDEEAEKDGDDGGDTVGGTEVTSNPIQV
eukprot:scaffold3842_cov150-Skeletonema_marinoi.AAC.1